MNQKITRISFIGLGRMGKPMAINLLKSGYDVAAYDVRHEPVRELAKLGARVAQSPKELARSSELIALAVVDGAQVVEVLLGADGVIEGVGPETIIALHSTVLPETVQMLATKFAAKQAHVLDAPISGGEAGARARSLCCMVGGEVQLLERCRDVFAASAAEIFCMGELGSGAATKLIVQVVTSTCWRHTKPRSLRNNAVWTLRRYKKYCRPARRSASSSRTGWIASSSLKIP